MNLGNLLSPDEILPAMRATDRASAIAELVDVLVRRGHLGTADRATIVAALLKREESASTAMGFGVALPHTFSDQITRRVMVFGWSHPGIEYSSLDGAPVHFVVLWVMPKNEFQTQLHTLSTIAKFLSDHTVRARLASARNTVEILWDLFPGNAPAPLAASRHTLLSMQTIPFILEVRLAAAVGDSEGISVAVQAATDARHGDYQSNVAMQLAKLRKTNPRQVAQDILAKLDVADLCAAPEIAGAGFLNFRLLPQTLDAHTTALAADPRLGVPLPAQPRTLVIDFSSPNVAKPMHVGHIRSTILGAALTRIARFAGHKVIADNHIGDWGTQFGKLLVGWKRELDRAALARDPIGELERLYKKINAECEADPVADEGARAEVVKLQNGDAENLAIWHEMIRLSQIQFDAIYQRLDIQFDVTHGESFYNPWLKDTVAELVQRGIATESKGAICVFSDGSVPEKEDPFLIKDAEGWKAAPALIQKADGAANYATTDMATIAYRHREWSPDEILYVTDGRQQLHFRQIFATWRRWHPESKTKLAHVWFGSILGEDGKPFKTRSGDTVKLSDLLDEAEERALRVVVEKNPELPEADRREIASAIGLGAVKYSDLLSNRQSDYVFSWDKMLSFQGNTAPYLQYSHVRIRSIFRKAAESGIALPVAGAAIAIREPAERVLAVQLARFGEVLPMVLDDYRPNLLCNYLFELAGAFHSFFEACPVLKPGAEAERASRLALCELTARVLKTGLGLLGITAPERM